MNTRNSPLSSTVSRGDEVYIPGRNRRNRNRGYSTIIVMFLLLLTVVLIFAMSGATLTQVRISRKGSQQANALVLAEAGVEDAEDHLVDGHNYTGTGNSSVTLYEDSPANTKPNGSFKTVVTPIDDWNLKVTSVGTTVDQVSATLFAIITIQKRKMGTPESGALKANGDIKISGTANIYTTPVNRHSADVLSNGSITMGSNSTVDGTLVGMGTISGGTGYYPSKTVTSPFSFNNTTTTNAMRTAWINLAKTGGTRGNVNSGTTLAGPLYINGNISLQNSERLILTGGANSIIFVNGDVSLAGSSVLTNGVTLVVNGTFSMGGSATYNIDSVSKPTPALVVYNSNNQTDAISLSGGSGTDQQGVIYAISGRMKVAGGSIVTGALYNGDPNSTIVSTGNYTQYFPLDMASIIDEPGDPSLANLVEP